jgi:hypothetical protein
MGMPKGSRLTKDLGVPRLVTMQEDSASDPRSKTCCAALHNMKANISTVALRVLTIVPVALALVVLAFAAFFTGMALREPLWVLFALSIALVACSVILLRCSYLAWRRPSPNTVREVCEWTGYALIGIAFLGFERLHSPGREWLAWTALIVSFMAVVIVEPWLTRFLLQSVFGVRKLRAG